MISHERRFLQSIQLYLFFASAFITPLIFKIPYPDCERSLFFALPISYGCICFIFSLLLHERAALRAHLGLGYVDFIDDEREKKIK